ncbi:MAG: Hpt domain-containing protein [Rhodospirillales bacterium]|nr:Hpt domain-containing protein [Rhodospirillales bacterium]
MENKIDPGLAEVKKLFFEESLEFLNDTALRLSAIGNSLEDTDSEQIDAVFRAVHSVKGGAGAWDLKDITSFAHTFESLLGAIREGDILISAEIAALLTEATDVLITLLQNSEQEIQTNKSVWAKTQKTLEEITSSGLEPSIQNEFASASTSTGNVEFQLKPILDNAMATELKSYLLELLPNAGHLVVKGDQVERVTTLGIQVLLATAAEMHNKGGAFEIINPSPLLEESIMSLGLESLLGK